MSWLCHDCGKEIYEDTDDLCYDCKQKAARVGPAGPAGPGGPRGEDVIPPDTDKPGDIFASADTVQACTQLPKPHKLVIRSDSGAPAATKVLLDGEPLRMCQQLTLEIDAESRLCHVHIHLIADIDFEGSVDAYVTAVNGGLKETP